MKRLWQSIAVCLVALGLLASAPSQALRLQSELPRNIQFLNLSTEDGFSSEFVNDVAQDGMGYMWFATQAGLNRYDGHEIRVYEHRSEDTGSLSHNFVRTLFVDHDGSLWAGTDRGVNRYDPAADQFDRQPLGPALSHQRVRKVTRVSSGDLWIATLGGGLFRFQADGTMTRFQHQPGEPRSLPSNLVMAIHQDQRGSLWIGTEGGGLARFEPADATFEVFRNLPDDPASLSDNDVLSIDEDLNGGLWIGTAKGGMNLFDGQSNRFVHHRHDPENPYSLGGGQVRTTFQDTRGSLWVGTETGLSEWRPSIGGFINYRRDPADRSSLVNNRINAIIEDASGVLWIATYGGVSSWNYVSDTFMHYASAQGYLQSDVVTSMAQTDDGGIWIATYGGGLTHLEPAGTVVHYRHATNDPRSLPDDRVMTVHVDGDDRVWAGTRTGGLCLLQPDDRFTCFVSDPDDPRSISGNAVSRLFSQRDGTLWVGVFGGGLNRLQWQDGRAEFQRFVHAPDDERSLSSDRVLAIYQDRQDRLWIGTENAGLNRLIAPTGQFERFDLDQEPVGDGSNPVSGTPWELHESTDGSLWIGTLGQGLLRWSAADRAAGDARFTQFGSAEGLATDIYGIVPGAPGELWLSSSRGLFRFDTESGAVRKFDRTNGLRSNEFNLGARLASADGRILFGGTKGLVAFSPVDFPYNPRPPAIDLVARSRTEMLARAGPAPAEITRGYFDPFVSFDFVALDFMSPDKNRYRYRLSGYDSEWNDARGSRRAIYSSVPAGSYTFQVQASNSDGVWNREGVAMALNVTAPPWKTGWAYAGYALAAIALFGGLLRGHWRRRARNAKRQAQLEELVRERTVELAARNKDLEALNVKLEEASLTDQLTGLRNRRYVDRHIESQVCAVQRRHFESKRPPTQGGPSDSSRLMFLMMVDLDGFKNINDTFGHHAGDQALLEVKARIAACCRESDEVIRWGGDEFLIVGHCSRFSGAEVLAEKIRTRLADRRYEVGKGCLAQLSGSVGVASIPFAPGRANLGTWTQVLAIADRGAYLAKANGRNAWFSLRGTDRFEEPDFHKVKLAIPDLVRCGKLTINSSISGDLMLDERPILQRVSSA